MSQTTQTLFDPEPPSGPNLTARTSRGVAWLMCQTAAVKVFTILGQIALAWFLTRDDFGLFGLCMTVAAFAGLIRQAGLIQVLVQRHDRFKVWAEPASWMSLALGITAGLFIVIAAPIAAIAYDEPRLLALMLVLSLESPIQSLAVVSRAKLQIDMRFRYIAVVGVAQAFTQIGLAVLFAWMGFGAMSFVLPRPIAAIVNSGLCWLGVRTPIRFRPHVRRWKYLFSETGWAFAGMIAYTITQQAAPVVLGILHPTAVVGLFTFAFNFAMQPIMLFTTNVQSVLMPALSRAKQHPARQAAAAVRGTRALAMLTMPACVYMAVSAEPLIRLLFDPTKWLGATTTLALLALAISFRAITPIAAILLQSQGRFRDTFLTHACSAAIFVVMVLAGAWFNAADGAALAFLLHAPITQALFFRASLGKGPAAESIRREGGWLAKLTQTIAAPLACAAAASVPVTLGSGLFPATRAGAAARIFAGAAVYFPLFAALAWTFARPACRETVNLFVSSLPTRVADRVPLFLRRPRAA